jgi:DNA-binding transcriptional LysR family regulator
MKRDPFPSLDDLRALDALARNGSIRKAGEELALTHGAVSRRIARISDALGKPITEAEGRGVRLTHAGQILAKATGQALALIKAAIEEIQDHSPVRAIVLSCERSIAARWLIPRLSAFYESYPNNPIHLSVGGGSIDFNRDGIDLALRRIDFPTDPSWEVMHFTDEAMGPVVAPLMEESFYSGSYIGLGSKSRIEGWDTWLNSHPNQPKPSELRLLDHHFLVAEAAVAGLGVGLVPKLVAIDAISKNQLLAPCGFDPDGSAYGLISPGDRESDVRLNDLRDWFTSIASD